MWICPHLSKISKNLVEMRIPTPPLSVSLYVICLHIFRLPWAHLPAAAENEAGQEPVRGRVRHRSGAADPRFPRGLCRGAGGGAEDRHVLPEAAWICLLGPELCLLVFRQRREECGLHAAGPGGDQDFRYGRGTESEATVKKWNVVRV